MSCLSRYLYTAGSAHSSDSLEFVIGAPHLGEVELTERGVSWALYILSIKILVPFVVCDLAARFQARLTRYTASSPM